MKLERNAVEEEARSNEKNRARLYVDVLESADQEINCFSILRAGRLLRVRSNYFSVIFRLSSRDIKFRRYITAVTA